MGLRARVTRETDNAARSPVNIPPRQRRWITKPDIEPMAKRHPSLVPLSHDHHHGLALALRCRKNALGQLNPGNPGSVADCVAEIKEFFQGKLESHFVAEEEALFPVISEHEEARAIIAELRREHTQMRQQVMGREPADPRKFLFDFGDILERHIRTEERVLFPIFEKWVSAERADQVGREIRQILHGDE